MKRTSLSLAALLLLTACAPVPVSSVTPASAPSVTAAAEAPVPAALEPVPAPSAAPVPEVTVEPVSVDPAPQWQPVAVEPAPVPVEPAPTPVPVEPAPTPAPAPSAPPVEPAPAPALDGMAWINATMAQYGAYPAAGTTITLGECPPYDACVHMTLYSDTGLPVPGAPQQLVFSPRAIGDVHLLLHEIAHTHSVMNECSADAWAWQHTGRTDLHSASSAC